MLVKRLESRLISQSYTVPTFKNSRDVAMSSQVGGWIPLPTHLVNMDMGDLWLRP